MRWLALGIAFAGLFIGLGLSDIGKGMQGKL